MRKLGIALLTLVITTTIVLLVRAQLRETSPAPARASAEPTATKTSPAVQPVDPTPAQMTAITPVAQTVRVPPPPKPERPLISGHISALDTQDGAAILKRAAAAYARIKSMRADFVQLRQNPLLGSNTTSRGTLYQRAPDRFALKFSQPSGDVILADGRYFWVYYPSVDRRQVIRATATAAGAGAVDLHSQFIGDPVRRFRYKVDGTQKLNGRSVHVLTLTPRADAGYQTMKVWIDASDALVRRFQITEPTGAVVEFQLSNLVINPTLGNDVFKFTPPADARIIER